MKFDWDEKKNKSNYTKHKVWFEEAKKVFADSHVRAFYDEFYSDDEERFLALGYSEPSRMLMVSHTYRGKTTIRIISARKATKKERLFYEKGI